MLWQQTTKLSNSPENLLGARGCPEAALTQRIQTPSQPRPRLGQGNGVRPPQPCLYAVTQSSPGFGLEQHRTSPIASNTVQPHTLSSVKILGCGPEGRLACALLERKLMKYSDLRSLPCHCSASSCGQQQGVVRSIIRRTTLHGTASSK